MDGRPAPTALVDNVSVTAVMSSATDHRRHCCIKRSGVPELVHLAAQNHAAGLQMPDL
jgi:hypothetical protein